MHLSNLPSLGLASILFNALHSSGTQLLRGGKLPIPELPSPAKLVGTNWQLKEIHGIPAIPDSQELFFETDTELSGYDGCNHFNGEWDTLASASQTTDRPRITIDIQVKSLRFCRLTEEAGEQQSKFMSTLRQEAISFSLSADEKELTLYHTIDGSDVPIVLSSIPRPVQPHERLIGTDWIATDIVYHDNQNELRPVLEDHPVALSFSQEQINGTTGTNQFFGDVPEMTPMKFQVTNVGQTTIGWGVNDDPRRLQEDAWMSILYFGRAVDMTTVNDDETTNQNHPKVVSLPYTLFDERIGDTDEWTQVLILGSFQAPMARFVPLKDDVLDKWGEPIKQIESPLAPRDDTPDYPFELNEPAIDEDLLHIQLAGSNWRATNIRGALISDDPNSQFYAEVSMLFTSEFTVEGRGGCNQFDASWEKLGTLIQMDDTEPPLVLEHMRVEDFVATKMYCDDMIVQIENYFFSGLTQESLFHEFNGEELTLWDAVMDESGHPTRGNFIGRFTNVPVPNWGGQSLIGMTGEEANAVVEDINPSLLVQIIPEGSMMTADYRLDRVRIFVEEDGHVAREPQRG